MRESLVEKLLRSLVDKAGGLCIKLNPLGYVGIPDRIVLLPGGVLIFVECKKPKGGKIAPMQAWWRDKLIGLGFRHEYVFTKDEARKLIEESTR